MDEDIVADVMSTLRLIPRWRLSSAEWDQVRGSLQRLAEAAGRGDVATVATAIDEVESHGPGRLASIARSTPSTDAGTDRLAPPAPVLEILNMLVHPAGGWDQAGSVEPPPAS